MLPRMDGLIQDQMADAHFREVSAQRRSRWSTANHDHIRVRARCTCSRGRDRSKRGQFLRTGFAAAGQRTGSWETRIGVWLAGALGIAREVKQFKNLSTQPQELRMI